MKDQLISIGHRKIPLVVGDGLTEVYFSGGVHGRKERGVYRFWTCHGEDRFGPWTIIGRARMRLSPGDRFARMTPERTRANPPAHRRIYAQMFRLANGTAFCIKPSTERELARWAAAHVEDCKFISGTCRIRGRVYKRIPRVL